MDKTIVSFLIRAKQATYAGKGAETAPSRTGSHDLVYRENNLMYYDTYLGGDRFAGEEALWISDVPYWSMNYIGRVTGSSFSGDFLFDEPVTELESKLTGCRFERAALSRVLNDATVSRCFRDTASATILDLLLH